MAPPWILDYVKMGWELLAQEAAEKAARIAMGDGPPENPYAKKFYRDTDRATPEQVQATIDRLKNEKHFQDVYITPNVAYYGQNNDRWGTYPYPSKDRPESWPPSERQIAGSGCAPSSLAIAYATLTGEPTTPPEVAEFAIHHGFSSVRPYTAKTVGGTNMHLIEEWAKEHQTDVHATKDLDLVRDRLKEGAVAVVHVHGGIFNIDGEGNPAERSHGHVIAVTGYAKDEQGKEWFFVANPGMDGRARRYADKLEDKGMTVDKSIEHHGAGMVRVRREVLEEYLKGDGAYLLSKQAA